MSEGGCRGFAYINSQEALLVLPSEQFHFRESGRRGSLLLAPMTGAKRF